MYGVQKFSLSPLLSPCCLPYLSSRSSATSPSICRARSVPNLRLIRFPNLFLPYLQVLMQTPGDLPPNISELIPGPHPRFEFPRSLASHSGDLQPSLPKSTVARRLSAISELKTTKPFARIAIVTEIESPSQRPTHGHRYLLLRFAGKRKFCSLRQCLSAFIPSSSLESHSGALHSTYQFQPSPDSNISSPVILDWNLRIKNYKAFRSIAERRNIL
ncbi:hypothetical protein R3P38DRAFT_2979655 [Favolaschia claudopus]|uniref:C2H2-type domain-containing protein n=1 Tax=Favolaschia claudopus TaxID=2862362 RepID=A0AAW0AZJ6_9AGAR